MALRTPVAARSLLVPLVQGRGEVPVKQALRFLDEHDPARPGHAGDVLRYALRHGLLEQDGDVLRPDSSVPAWGAA